MATCPHMCPHDHWLKTIVLDWYSNSENQSQVKSGQDLNKTQSSGHQKMTQEPFRSVSLLPYIFITEPVFPKGLFAKEH